MGRGVVVRFAPSAESELRAMWQLLSARSLPSLMSHTHGLHTPHLTLVVAQELDLTEARAHLAGIALPRSVTFESLGYLPQGVLHLAAVPTIPLLRLHHRVYDSLLHAGALRCLREHVGPNAWVPHVTLAYGLLPDVLGEAVALLKDRLPLTCALEGLWLEDGDTGESWSCCDLIEGDDGMPRVPSPPSS
jgi:hypothetical protein